MQRIRRLNTITTLFLLFSLSGFAILLIMIYMNWKDVRQKTYSNLEHVNTFVYSAFEADLYKYDTLLQLLGERLADLDVMRNPEAGRALLERTLSMNPNLAGFGVARPDGQLTVVTNVPPTLPLPSLLNANNCKETFNRVLLRDGITLGRTYYMKALGKWVVPLRAPIFNAKGELLFIMTAGINVRSKSNIWQPENLPEHITTLLIDDDFYFLFVSPLKEEALEHYYNTPLPKEILSQIDPSIIHKPGIKKFSVTDRDGIRVLATSVYHPSLGITSVTTIPYRDVLMTLFDGLRYLLLGTALFYGFSFLLYLYMNRRDKGWTAELLWNASHDTLTGLPNRFFLQEKTKQWHASHRQYSALFLDLDNFKGVNDNYGHPFGDKLLHEIAIRLSSLIDTHEYVIRQGGDEFIVLTTRAPEKVGQYAEQVRHAIATPVRIDKIVVHPTVSIGIAHYPKDADELDGLLSKADMALYAAKDHHRGYFEYSNVLDAKAKRRYMLESELRRADLSSEIHIVYQPQFDVETLRIVGVEALARWRSPVLGDISPGTFIPVAEETALILSLGAHMLETACIETVAIWQETHRRFRLAVNVSAQELLSEGFAQRVISTLDKVLFPPSMLTLEVTESVFIDQTDQARTVLQTLRSHGVGVALDDFGTGYSSLSMLLGLPLSELKIDKSFLEELDCDLQKQAIVKSIITLSAMFDLIVIAEGADAPYYDFLKESGCDVLQGFHYGKPQNADALCKLMGH